MAFPGGRSMLQPMAVEARDAADPEYARVASAMPFVEGTLAYELYREIERL